MNNHKISKKEFDSMMMAGLNQAKANDSRLAEIVFRELKNKIKSISR